MLARVAKVHPQVDLLLKGCRFALPKLCAGPLVIDLTISHNDNSTDNKNDDLQHARLAKIRRNDKC